VQHLHGIFGSRGIHLVSRVERCTTWEGNPKEGVPVDTSVLLEPRRGPILACLEVILIISTWAKPFGRHACNED
jgi:hypothetical protein